MGIEKELEESGGLARTAKDLFAGAAGGIAQVLLGKTISACFLLLLCFIFSSTSFSLHNFHLARLLSCVVQFASSR